MYSVTEWVLTSSSSAISCRVRPLAASWSTSASRCESVSDSEIGLIFRNRSRTMPAILGSREILKKGSWSIRPGTVTVRFGEPISVRGLGLSHRNELTEQAWAALASLQAADGK